MGLETLGMPIAFTLLAACLLWFVIGSKGWWWVKMVCIATTLYCGVAMWNCTTTFLGWPAKRELPALYLVHWAVVNEPDKITSDKGGIYLWLKDIDKNPEVTESWLDIPFFEYQAGKKEPRAYALPYSKELHEGIQGMMRGLKQGKVFIGGEKAGQQGAGKGDGKGKGNGQGKNGKGKSSSLYQYQIPQVPEFYELPPPAMPQKNPE